MHWTALWNAALHWISTHPTIAYPAIFFIALSESLALIGLLIPGTVLMIGIGALVGNGALALQPTLLIAMVGAVAGDGISFWLGKHYHRGIKNIWPFRNYPDLLLRGETFFHHHGGKSVFLGRFVGPIRPIIPVIAGTLDMPIKNFLLVNILSAIGWAFVYIIPGVLLGSSLTLIGAVSMRLSLLSILLLLLIWLGIWLSKKLYGWLSHLAPQSEQRLLLLLGVSLGAAGWLFLGVLEDVVHLDPLVRADQSIYQILQTLRTPWGDQIMVAVTELGDSLMNALIAAGVLLALLFKRQFRAAAYWLVAVAGGAGLVQLFKWLLHRPRPIDIYHGVSSWGFPSGHSTMSVVLFGFLAILLAHSFSPGRRWFPFATAIGLSLLIAFSRIYLGAHWFSDILGGLSLGWAWATLLGLLYLRQQTGSIPKKPVVAVFFGVLIVAGGWHIQQRHDADLARYQVQEQIKKVSFAAWQQKAWQQLPAWRVDVEGEEEQPLTFQWAGDPAILAEKLRRQGWHDNAGLTGKQLLNLFAPNSRIGQLPLLHQLADGHRERLLLSRDQNNRRLVLRLWPSSFRTTTPNLPLWVGNLDSERAVSAAGLLTLPRGEKNYTEMLRELRNALPKIPGSLVKRMGIDSKQISSWSGQVLLMWDNSHKS